MSAARAHAPPAQDDDVDQFEGLEIALDTLPPLPESPVDVRRGSSRSLSRPVPLSWNGPFSTPLRGPPSVEDVAMPTASPVQDDAGQWQVMTAPALPKHPVYKGSTMPERRAFIREYETYYRALSACVTPTYRPFVIPVSACIEEQTGRLICAYELKKDPSLVSEDEWIAYFKESLRPDHHDYTAVDQAMQRLRTDLTLTDAKSRMGKLRADMHRILDQHNVEAVMMDKEQKKLVNYMVAGLGPDDFRDGVKTRLSNDENKKYRGNVIEFYGWATSLMESSMLWRPAVTKPPKTPARTPDNKPARGTTPQQQGTGGAPGGSTNPAKQSTPPVGGCLKCQSREHRVKQCPLVASGEAVKLINEHRAKREGARVNALATDSRSEHEAEKGTASALIDDVLKCVVLFDSGADDSVVSAGVVNALVKKGVFVSIATVSTPSYLRPVGGRRIQVNRRVRLGVVKLETTAGPLILRGIECWVHEQELTSTLIVSRAVMKTLGYSTDGLLASARARSEEWQLDDGASPAQLSPMIKLQTLSTEVLEQYDMVEDDEDGPERLTDAALLRTTAGNAVEDALRAAHEEAINNGLPAHLAGRLWDLLLRFIDCFRLVLGDDPLLKVEPLLVRQKLDARPVKAKLRRYPPVHEAFLEQHLSEKIKNGRAKMNPDSHWAAAPRVVPKKSGEFRMTVDHRPQNSQTDPLVWPMPDLESDMSKVEGSECFFDGDVIAAFDQLPLHEKCQEMFTIIAKIGMVTPLTVPMGSSDSVPFCQQAMEQVAGPLLYKKVLVWLDDILGFAKAPDELLDTLEAFLLRCEQFGLKLHAKKCHFFKTKATWCGRIISKDGVGHSPERVQGLVEMAEPQTAGDLQQFLCAVGWMRQSIPQFAGLVGDLNGVLDAAAKSVNSRKKIKLQKVLLSTVGWNQAHVQAVAAVKAGLLQMIPLAHPKPDSIVCVFTDASLNHWGAAVTQIPREHVHRPLDQQDHRPLAFLSGSFKNASSRWAIVEKEAFAIVETCKRLMYLLLRPDGFKIYTDHRNLQYIFNPQSVDTTISRFQADKLQRWASTLSLFRYEIEHVAGDANVWGDLLSRWGSVKAPSSDVWVRTVTLLEHVSPLQSDEFLWPTHEEIHQIQTAAIAAMDRDGPLPPCQWSDEKRLMVTESGAVWVPKDAGDLQTRLCVLAHAGSNGHRGLAATTKALRNEFTWDTVEDDVSSFLRGCLHCLTVNGKVEPRPFGPAMHGTKPNEVLHFDYLTLPVSAAGTKYVLVLKDDMSGFVELVECAVANADSTADALLNWFKRYGVCTQWVSDRGTHFKNETIEKLRKLLAASHHFTTAYCPWANGTVEVVNRQLTKCMKALMSELKMHQSEWSSLLPVVQAALNNMPSDRLGGTAPITAFTALPATTALSTIIHPRTNKTSDVGTIVAAQRAHIKDVSDALEAMHKQLSDEAERKRVQARRRQNAKRGVEMANFTVGDFVLVAQVAKNVNKLAVTWRGPKRIVTALTDHIFEVQDLVAPFAVSTHHASRLRFYRDRERNVTTEMEAQAIHGSGGHLVKRLMKCRLSGETQQCELLVDWVGLDPDEASWESAARLYEDVPAMLTKFVDDHPTNHTVQAMWKVLQDGIRRPAPREQAKGKSKQSKGQAKASKSVRGGGK